MIIKRNSYGGISQWRMSALTKSNFNPSPTIAQCRMDALTKKDRRMKNGRNRDIK